MRVGSAFLRADGYPKNFVLDLRQRGRPTLQVLESHQSLLQDHREVVPPDDEEHEQAPSLNQELEEESTST